MFPKFFDSLEYKPKLENFSKEKVAFLKEFNLKYGYYGKIDQIREEEYPQLNGKLEIRHNGYSIANLQFDFYLQISQGPFILTILQQPFMPKVLLLLLLMILP